MKRVYVFVALLMCSPVAALAQIPPVPPVPPTPMVAPVPPVPPVPRVAPVPPVPPVGAMFVMAPPIIEPLELDMHMALADAKFALEDLNFQDIKDKVLRDIDLESIKEQAKMAAEEAKAQAEVWKEQAKEQAKFATDQAFKMDYAFQVGRGQGMAAPFRVGEGDGQYSSGLSAVDNQRYDQAIVQFDRVINAKGTRADGALYWKAYAQYKLGKTDDANASLAELRKSYPQSKYLNDAKVLEADAKKTSGKPVNDDDKEIKLLAISALQNSDPAAAVPLLENVLKQTNTLSVKKRAIYVLAQNDLPAAHQLLVNYAKGSGNPDLQIEAIRYLTARSGGLGRGRGPGAGSEPNKTTTAELEDIYNSTQDVSVKRAVLNALLATGDRTIALRLSGGNTPAALRGSVLSNMASNNMISAADLMGMYQKEENKELRQTMLNSFASMQAVDQLIQIIKTEKEPSLRQQAIRSLGRVKSDRTGPTLSELYGSEQDKDVRKAVISAFGSQNNAEGLVAIAKKETDKDLKLEIVRRIADLAPKNKVAMDYLMEQIK